jgi:putative tryptophan/tyrosine transport system substrate-binding protein
MKRRDLMLLLGGAAITWPRPAPAQHKAMLVIGYLHPGAPDGPALSTLAAFHQGLGDAGYIEGQNVAIEYRWAEGHYDRLPAFAADLAGRKVDLIAAVGNAALAAKDATSTIPIVFMGAGEPVVMGLVANLARPGGNLTGFSNLIGDLMPKRLELLAELVPQAKMTAVLLNPNAPSAERIVQEAARAKGLQLAILKAGTEGEIDATFASLVELHVDAVLVVGDVFFANRHKQLVALASRHGVPTIYPWRFAAEAGGLMSYGISNPAVWRQAGIYAGRILKGEKPADLPVQQPTKFELVINLKTAKALGLTVPQSMLQRADELIE